MIRFQQNGETYGNLGTFGNDNLMWGSSLILHSNNYTNYCPTKTGSGASGTWGISITGDSATVGGKSSSDFVHYRYIWEDQSTDNEAWARTNATNYPQSITYNSQGYERVYISMMNSSKSNGVILKLDHNGPKAHLMGRLNNTWTAWKELCFTDHTHPYLPLSGGTITGTVTFTSTDPIMFNQPGSGTYNKCAIFIRNGAFNLELPRETDSGSANIIPLHIKTRGGQWAPIYAGGFYKGSSDNSYVLLGGGGHKLESSLSVSYASSSGTSSDSDKLGGLSADHFMNFQYQDDYINASFRNLDYSAKARQKYIEFWDGGGRDDTGWYKFRLGELRAVDGGLYVGDNPVIHSGNIGSQSVNYANSAGSSTYATYLNVSTQTDLNSCVGDNICKYYRFQSGASNQFSVINNANGLLWLGTHAGTYGAQIGISSNGRLYHRHVSANSFGGWSTIAFTTDLPTKTSWNYDDVYLKLSGGTLTGTLVIDKGSDSGILQSKYNGTIYNIIRNHNNGNVSISACGSGLYLGYEGTQTIYCRGSYINIDSNNWSSYIGTSSSHVGYSTQSTYATYVTSPYAGYSSADTISDSTTSDNMCKASNGTLYPVFHNTDWGWSDTLYWSGYGKWGGTQLATEYNKASNVRVKIRKYTQSGNKWGEWTEFITSGNIRSQSVSNADTLDSYHAEDILKKICGRNLIKKSVISGGRTTVEGYKIKTTPKTNQGDTYFYITPINDLPAGKYIFSFTCSGFSENDYWNFAWQNNSSQGICAARNGRNIMILNHPSLTTANTHILIDDQGSAQAANSDTVYFYDFALYSYDTSDYSIAPEEIAHTPLTNSEIDSIIV